jgi:hypothetical protein
MRDFQAQQMAMMQAIANRPVPSPFANMNIPEVITAITAAISVLRPPPAPAPPPAQVVDQSDRAINMLLKGIELAKDLGGGGGGESSLMDVMRDMVKSPVIAAAVQAASHPQPMRQPAPRPVVSHAKLPHTPQSTPQPTPAPMNQPQSAHTALVGYLTLLTAKAAEGADPGAYAQIILDNLDEELIISLLNRRPTPVDALISDYPPAAEQRAWFEDLVSIIQEAFEDDEGGESEGGESMPESEASDGVTENGDASGAGT